MLKDLSKQLLTKENILSVIGGIVFVVIFMWGYSHIDTNWYDYRDDGVITMSTAKNLVDAGFIGVSVSGPIVEASSSPMQFFTYAFTYLVTGVDYANFSHWQTIIATFLLGFIFIRFFADKPIIALFLTALSAIGLTQFYPFFEWHASGMENAITHVLFLATIYILYKSVKESNINYWLAIIVFMATIARLDSVYHIGMLLIIYSVYWVIIYKNLKAFYFSLVVFVLWLIFQLWRYYYFGDILPNTAYAQGISMSDRLHSLLSLDQSFIRQSFNLAKEIFMKQAGWLLIAVLSLLYFFKPTKSNIFLIVIGLSVVITSYFNPFLFGATRIDHARTTTQMAVIVFLIIAMIIYASKTKRSTVAVLTLLLPFVILFYNYQDIKAYYLGWSTNGFNNVRTKFMKIAKENDIKRPTISNPDLGVMTWYKELNDIDLGMLGSPIMAKIKNGPQMTEYYLNFGLPDLIEAHGGWVRRYCNSIFTQGKFGKLYSQVGTDYDMKKVCSDKKNPPMIYWIRNDIKKDSVSKERRLLNDLQKQLTVRRIKQEVANCQGSTVNCNYIARTVYKFIPELREADMFDNVYSLFKDETDKALLRGWKDGQAHEVIIDAVQDKLFHIPEKSPDVNATWNLYLEDKTLTYVKTPCNKKDTKHTFYLHVFPRDTSLKLNDGGGSFKNMDFKFNGLIKDDTCIVVKQLPYFQIKAIHTGQYSTYLDKDKKKKFKNYWSASISVE